MPCNFVKSSTNCRSAAALSTSTSVVFFGARFLEISCNMIYDSNIVLQFYGCGTHDKPKFFRYHVDITVKIDLHTAICRA